MKNVHDIAKALAPDFGISVREAYYYVSFIMDTVYRKVASQEYNAVVIPSVGNIYMCRASLKRRIDQCQNRLDKLNSEEHFRNSDEEYKKEKKGIMEKEIRILTERYNKLNDYRNIQQEFYDYKIKRTMARNIIRTGNPLSTKNGYVGFESQFVQPGIQPDPSPVKTPLVSMDTSPPDYL